MEKSKRLYVKYLDKLCVEYSTRSVEIKFYALNESVCNKVIEIHAKNQEGNIILNQASFCNTIEFDDIVKTLKSDAFYSDDKKIIIYKMKCELICMYENIIERFIDRKNIDDSSLQSIKLGLMKICEFNDQELERFCLSLNPTNISEILNVGDIRCLDPKALSRYLLFLKDIKKEPLNNNLNLPCFIDSNDEFHLPTGIDGIDEDDLYTFIQDVTYCIKNSSSLVEVFHEFHCLDGRFNESMIVNQQNDILNVSHDDIDCDETSGHIVNFMDTKLIPYSNAKSLINDA
ncbi:hypothetical protein C9J12_18050 [Photobacterium frigidiphilum]|uniref:ABC-three component systems C-terminal domain-containing protein n=1 Tax=Photobacterium frigidiphilum TaxID=264736 RepID=A0A2T3JCP0_9GAMM|nr:ABC-three component system protein [Photobacterium frigidiphilum]PSU46613.1 hypothetical protein C9J12_18050 [Photobacterium frigidiphilum]